MFTPNKSSTARSIKLNSFSAPYNHHHTTTAELLLPSKLCNPCSSTPTGKLSPIRPRISILLVAFLRLLLLLMLLPLLLLPSTSFSSPASSPLHSSLPPSLPLPVLRFLHFSRLSFSLSRSLNRNLCVCHCLGDRCGRRSICEGSVRREDEEEQASDWRSGRPKAVAPGCCALSYRKGLGTDRRI